MSKIFGFIGVGNMGGALARAACRSAGAEMCIRDRGNATTVTFSSAFRQRPALQPAAEAVPKLW